MNWDLFVKIAVPVGTWVLGIFGERWKQQAPKLLMYLGHASVFHDGSTKKTNPSTRTQL